MITAEEFIPKGSYGLLRFTIVGDYAEYRDKANEARNRARTWAAENGWSHVKGGPCGERGDRLIDGEWAEYQDYEYLAENED